MRRSSSRARAAWPVDLRAGAAQLTLVAAADGDEPGQADLAVAGGQLGLAPRSGLLGLALACGLGLPEAASQLAVGAVARDRGLDLTRRAFGRDRLERDRHRAHRARICRAAHP